MDIVIAFLIFFGVQWIATITVTVITMLTSGWQLITGHLATNIIAATLIISSVISIVLIVFFKHLYKINILDEIKPANCKWKWVPLLAVATLCGILCFNIFSEYLNLEDIIEEQLMELATSFWGIIAIVILGPLTEELVFRSAILGNMLYRGVNTWTAIIVSSFLFGIAHLNPSQIPFAFLLGILFGILYVKTRSVVPGIICHIINNSLSVIMINLYSDKPDMTFEKLFGSRSLTCTLAVITAVICTVSYYYYWRKR